MHVKRIISAGKKPEEADRVLIMVHGRGGSAEDILSLANYFPVEDYALLAPQAANHTWYPYSFLAPPVENEPWLTSALELLREITGDILKQGFQKEQVYFLGFSQGACLTLEFVTRNAGRWGGVVAFTGGLIGDRIEQNNYKGDFNSTPVFIGTSDPDPHVPVSRVHETQRILKEMNADARVKIYPNMGHTISGDEIEEAKRFIFI